MGAISRARAAVAPHLGEITGGLGVVAGALLSFDDSRWWGVAVSVLAVISLCLSVAVFRLKRKRRASNASEVTISISEASNVQEVLKAIAIGIGLPHPWRISMYEVEDGAWSRIARRSSIPRYQNAEGRLTIELDTGCLGRALRTGGVDEIQSLPKRSRNFDGWVAMQTEVRIAYGDAEKFRMPSRYYGAVVHEIPFGPFSGVHVGVVVESEKENGATRAAVERALPLETVALLHKLVKVAPLAQRLEAVVADHRAANP